LQCCFLAQISPAGSSDHLDLIRLKVSGDMLRYEATTLLDKR
jgi:hypothetical protein